MLFELAAVLSSLVGTSERRVRLPQRYSSLRIRQIEQTFGFDDVVGTPLPWDELDRAVVRIRRRDRQFHLAAGASLRTAKRVPHPISVLGPRPTRWRNEESGWASTTRSGSTRNSFAAMSTASFATTSCPRHRSGFSRPTPSGQTPRSPPVARPPDHPDGRSLLHRRPQQAAGRRDRGLSRLRQTARPDSSSPSPGPSIRALKGGTGSTSSNGWRPVSTAPSIRTSDAPTWRTVRALRRPDPRRWLRGRPGRVPRTSRTFRDHADRSSKLFGAFPWCTAPVGPARWSRSWAATPPSIPSKNAPRSSRPSWLIPCARPI